MYELNGKEWRLDGEPGWTMRNAKDALEKGSGIPWFLRPHKPTPPPHIRFDEFSQFELQ